MSETVSNDVSTESLCTVIENCSEHSKLKAYNRPEISNETDDSQTEVCNNSVSDYSRLSSTDNESARTEEEPSFNSNITNSDTSIQLQKESPKPRSKLKKSVSFDPNDENIRKFVTGDPIVDQQNPFKYNGLIGSAARKKKVPPPVPTKRSTLSVKKTVTQQLREREREKEKERERLKNEANNRKSHANGNATLPSPDEFITTEEVLKQSKYVKTYIKNPDPYFVYDPLVLARIKFDELREIADKKPLKKLKLTNNTRERLKDLKNKSFPADAPRNIPTFKKCSKPNYPELADIKVKVGTDSDGNYFNPAEVTKNVKKFDERVKKLHLACDDDLDELDEPLTKSESSDEVTANQQSKVNEVDTVDGGKHNERGVMNGMNDDRIKEATPAANGTFTNTIKSKEFQEYLEKKGLTLIPKKIPNGAQPVYTNGMPRPNTHISFRAPERVQISIDNMDGTKGNKKPSVFQRLLANSIFASRRRTTPKETVPTPKESSLKRVVLERQSFHGRPRASNLLSEFEATDLRSHPERTRKSYASGDDLSVSISSALTNAEYAVGSDIAPASLRKSELQLKPIVKPPRRTLSRDRLGNAQQQQLRQSEPQDSILKPKVHRAQIPSQTMSALPKERIVQRHYEVESDGPYLKRSLERQSLIPKRTTQATDRRQVFGRSASMDRNEILKRNAARGLQQRSRSATGTLKANNATNNDSSYKENLNGQLAVQNGPKLTSTPVRDAAAATAAAKYEPNSYGSNMEANRFAPIANNLVKPPATGVYVDQQEWEQLKAIKERTDRELYYKVLQQQQQQQLKQDAENIYEHLQPHQVLMSLPQPSRAALQQQQRQLHEEQQQQQQQQQQLLANENFVRGSQERNTFSGVIRNRQVKIIDGKAVLATTDASIPTSSNKVAVPTARSQSVLDGMTQAGRPPGLRRGYESDTETPVIMRRKQASGDNQPIRRIGGILTREEILQKVKEFCRKSINKTPTNQPQMQAIYEKQPIATDLSPVSYVSVETHHRPGSRVFAVPQVPQRMQSLPEQFVPISHELIDEQHATTASPIYAHVVKRSSLQSNPSELYESSPRPYLVRRESDAQTIYVSRGTLPRPELVYAQGQPPPLPQYLIVDGDKITPAQVLNYSQAELYTQPQYIRPHQLQPMPGTYGYITVRDPMTQQLRAARLHDGRSTPLILDRSSQHASQIYWTPQHQQHAGLLPIEISPRYTLKQAYPVAVPVPVATPRTEPNSRATRPQAAVPNSIPNQLQQKKSSTIARINLSSNMQQQPLQKQQQQLLRPTTRQLAPSSVATEYNAPHPAYEWESGSEAGEVQRIMEHQKNSGEFKTYNIFKNLKAKIARLVRGGSKR